MLLTPPDQNPFVNDTASTCWDLGGKVAPFGPRGSNACTVDSATRILVVARSGECSHWELPASRIPNLLACARGFEPKPAKVTVDGQRVTLTPVITQPLTVTLPADNIFGAPANDLTGQFQAVGDLVDLGPLSNGTHVITVVSDTTITTTITVTS
jgi:hypothetical protein